MAPGQGSSPVSLTRAELIGDHTPLRRPDRPLDRLGLLLAPTGQKPQVTLTLAAGNPLALGEKLDFLQPLLDAIRDCWAAGRQSTRPATGWTWVTASHCLRLA